MSDNAFRCLLNMFMCCDPWPLSEAAAAEVDKFLNEESQRRGYQNWIVAYHKHEPKDV